MALAKQFKVPFLGAVPLDPRIAKCCDFGESFVDEFPDSAATKAFLSVVNGTHFLPNFFLAYNRCTTRIRIHREQ